MQRWHDVSWTFCDLVPHSAKMCKIPMEWVHFKLGWGSWAGTGLRELDVFLCSAPCPRPTSWLWHGYSWLSRWQGCGWIGQAAPVNGGFLTCRKVLGEQRLVLYWLPFKRADMQGVKACFSLYEGNLCESTFIFFERFCLFFCHRFSRDGCGTSAMAPFVFTCKSKQLAMLIKELFLIK